MRISIADLRKHNKPDDAWAAFYGKVYNITPYLPFHPGGQHELMRVAGRDGTKLFGAFFTLGMWADWRLMCSSDFGSKYTFLG